MEISGLEKKEFEITIQWIVEANVIISEGTEDILEHLRGIGIAEITDIVLRDKK